MKQVSSFVGAALLILFVFLLELEKKEADQKRRVAEVVQPSTFFMVDHRQSLRSLIRAGRYNFFYSTDEKVLSGFQNSYTANLEFKPKLFKFPRVMVLDSVVKEMESEGFRPAKVEELLVYGSTVIDDEKRKYLIVALGTFFRDGIMPGDAFPTVQALGTRRYFVLVNSQNTYHPDAFFLGVRK